MSKWLAWHKKHNAAQRAYNRAREELEKEYDCTICDENVTLNEPMPRFDVEDEDEL